MPRLLWLAEACRAAGLDVFEVAGWQTRGSSEFHPRGVLAHHTAGPKTGDYPSLRIVRDGRPDLPGPLAQVGLGRSGRVYVIASGRANHAGSGAWKGLSGNANFFGIEAENTGVGEPWPKAQLDAYDRLCAVLLERIGRDASWLAGHKEYATPKGRKVDPAGIDMAVMRNRVQRLLDAQEEDDMTAEEVRVIVAEEIRRALFATPHVNQFSLADHIYGAATDAHSAVQLLSMDDG